MYVDLDSPSLRPNLKATGPGLLAGRARPGCRSSLAKLHLQAGCAQGCPSATSGTSLSVQLRIGFSASSKQWLVPGVRSSMLGYRHVLGQFKLARASCSFEKLLLLLPEKPRSQLCSHTHNTGRKKTSCAQHDGASLGPSANHTPLPVAKLLHFYRSLSTSHRSPNAGPAAMATSGHLPTLL